MAATQRVVIGGESTWTVVSKSFAVVEPIESYLEFGRQGGLAANTVKAYAKGLAQWWTYLENTARSWESVDIRDFGRFLFALRHNEFEPEVTSLIREVVVAESTVQLRLRAVTSFYRYHAGCGNDVAPFLYRQVCGRFRKGHSFLEHIARRRPHSVSTVKVRVPRRDLPILTPDIVGHLLNAEATFSSATGDWHGDLRYRLLWSVLAETGMRLGEALALQHRDWMTGKASTATVKVTDRPHPHGLSAKTGRRTIHIGSRLDRLYGDYVWWLCDRGGDAAIDDWDSSYIFCNTRRGTMYAPLRPESVYAHLRSVKRRVHDLPKAMTPHWFRHTHASALLLSGIPLHVVSRRLGHQNIQTTIHTYGHVTEDAELEALANWRDVVAGWSNADGQ